MVDSRWRLKGLGAVFSAAAMVGCGGGSESAPEVRETVYGAWTPWPAMLRFDASGQPPGSSPHLDVT